MAIIRLQGDKEKSLGIYYEVNTECEPLGAGGMGQVYKGSRVEQATGVCKDVAIKFLFDDLPQHIIDRARREASIQIQNENLVEMFGFVETTEIAPSGEIKPRYHVVSELLNGVMLYDLLRGTTTNRVGEEIAFAKELYDLYQNERALFAIRVVKSVLSGIMALHDNGYIHRDIDPSNIMITADCKIKVIDFGIAKQISSSSNVGQLLTTTGQFMGKAAYSAPELVSGDVIHQNESTDLYAIGILFFQLLAGRLPFEGPNHEVAQMQKEQKIPLHLLPPCKTPQILKEIKNIIAKATDKKQSNRYQSAAEFRVALEQLEKNILPYLQSEKKEEGPVPEPFVRRMTRMLAELVQTYGLQIAIGGAVVLLLCGGVGGVLAWKKNVERKKAEEVARIEEKERLDSLHIQRADSIIDSSDPAVFEYYQDTNDTIKSAAMLTSEAIILLQGETMYVDSIQIEKGLHELKRVIEKGYTSSAEAAHLLALIYRSGGLNDTMRIISPNIAQAFLYDSIAVQLDSTHHRALYEYGCDFLAGEYRTGLKDSRNIDRASSYILKAYRYALIAEDSVCMEKCARRLQGLGKTPSQ